MNSVHRNRKLALEIHTGEPDNVTILTFSEPDANGFRNVLRNGEFLCRGLVLGQATQPTYQVKKDRKTGIAIGDKTPVVMSQQIKVGKIFAIQYEDGIQVYYSRPVLKIIVAD